MAHAVYTTVVRVVRMGRGIRCKNPPSIWKLMPIEYAPGVLLATSASTLITAQNLTTTVTALLGNISRRARENGAQPDPDQHRELHCHNAT